MNSPTEPSPPDVSSNAQGSARLERLNAMLLITAALSEAVTPTDVAQIIVGRGIDALGANAGSVALLSSSNDTLEVVSSVGYPVEVITPWLRIPMSARVPLTDAVRTGSAIWLESDGEVAERYPELATRQRRVGGVLAAIPLLADGAPIGCIGLNFPAGHRFTSDDRAFMVALARQCTMALERSRLYEAEQRERRRAEDAEKRLRFLAGAGEILASSLDETTTLQSIARLIVPELADGCTIHLKNENGTIDWTTIAHVDPRKEEILHMLAERNAKRTDADLAIKQVVASGEGIFSARVEPDALESFAGDDEHRELLRSMELASIVIVPLTAHGTVQGAIVLARSPDAHPFTDEDFALAVDLGRRAGLALDSAKRFEALHREVAERIRVEQALGASELRHRTIFEQSPLSIQTFAPDGTMRGANRAWEELWGATVEQARGYNVLNDPQLEARGVMSLIRRAFAGERIDLPAVPYDPAEIGRPGRRRWVRPMIYPVLDENGVQEVVLVHEDVTNRIESEEKLRRSEERYRALIETAPDVIYSLSVQDGTIIALNPAFEALTGWQREQWIGQPFHPLVHPDDLATATELFMMVSSGESPPPYELRIQSADGSYRTGEFRSRPRLENGIVVEALGIARDVTDRKEAELELIAAKNAAESASRAKDQFLATLSHELRTPLTPVLAAVQALEEDDVPEEMTPLLEIIRRNIELEAHLIDDMLDLTRIARGKIPLQIREVDPNQLLGHVMEICRAAILEKRLVISLELDAREVKVAADPARLQQVFWNLFQNAVKFTPPEGSIILRSKLLDKGWRLEVVDSGIGIPRELLPHIFNAFEQGDATITRQFGGLGLGLAISKALIVAHGGTLRASSDGAGKGAVFTVELVEATDGTS